ncbi:MAG: ABC transporter ATP-binding protein [Sporichthyaceae bacterium]|nr:ABC transporter ATP-binding protein [Sporichthyaceae bacterium]
MPTRPETAAPTETLIEVEELEVHFRLQGSSLARLFGRDTGHVRAVDGVSLELHQGEVVGLVGESGSGKTTLGRALLGLEQPTGGRIRYGGKDITRLGERDLRSLRTELQMVFQDPNAALNPAMTIARQVGHPLRIHGLAKGRDDLRAKVSQSLERVGLAPVERFLDKYPSDLSGGQKQRAVIARAIITGPRLLVADEPISMLDMSVRSKILQLMLDLKNDLGLTYVYITHDLASAKFFCDRVAIMYLGRIVEIGRTEEIFRDPKHPYTKALLAAIPDPDPDRALPRDLPRGEIPDAADPPSGCAFHPRCPRAFEACGWEPRDLQTLLDSHWASVSVEDYEREREVVGDLSGLERARGRAVLRPGAGSTAADVRALLDRLRAADPEEPFWRGVESVDVEGGDVIVTFAPAEDPVLRTVSAVRVACHLYEA